MKEPKLIGHYFPEYKDKKKYPPFYMDWISQMGLIVANMGVVKKGKWHTVEFYINVNEDNTFYIDEFRISSVKRKRK